MWNYSSYDKVSPVAESAFPFESPRPDQLETVSEILEAISKGYKYIVLEAGTGTGKSAIAATLANISDSTYILTSTKQLQDQYVNDFNDFRAVKGRSNFGCRKYADDGIIHTCDEGRCILEGYSCEYSLKNQPKPTNDNMCHYFYQKFIAMNSRTVIANYPYLFLELNYVRDFQKRDLLICDEAHNLEQVLMNQLKLEFSRSDLKEYIRYDLIYDEVYDLINGEYSDWIDFIGFVRDEYTSELDRLESLDKPGLREKISFIKNQIADCSRSIGHITEDPTTWIVDWDDEFETLKFKPLKVDNYAKRTLFDYCDVCIFMSATILDWKLFAHWLGISADEIYAIRRKSPFQISNNRIIPSSKYNLSRASIRVNAPRTVELIEDLLKRHENEKGIIHTVSAKCMEFLIDNIDSDRLIGHETSNRAEQLERFKNSTEPLVLISPSMDEGVDLPGDLCRFQIIYKIPYPDLGDRQVFSRMQLDSHWYDYKTSLRLVQTHGRGMRYTDDYCTTYFIDSRFKNYVFTNRFLPDTFRKAIMTDYDPKLKESLIEKGDSLMESEDYESAIRFFNELVNNELFLMDSYPYLKLSQAYHEAELFEDELNTILKFLSLDMPCSEMDHFKNSLKRLSEMGYC